MNWLFLRGLGRQQRHWGSFPETFIGSLAGDKVFFLDLPGSGTELRRRSPQSVRAICDDVHERFLSLKKREGGDWSLLALSLGGMVALDWAGRYPEEIKNVVLINSSAANLSLPWERLNWKLIPTLLKASTQKDPVLREKAILMLTSNRARDELDRTAVQWASFADNPTLSRKNALKQLAAAVAFKAPAKEKIHSKVLVLSSMRDRFTSSKCSYALARYYGFHQAVHPTAGHDLSLDDPEWVSEQVRVFLQKA